MRVASASAGTMRTARPSSVAAARALTTFSVAPRALVLPISTSPSRRGTR